MERIWLMFAITAAWLLITAPVPLFLAGIALVGQRHGPRRDQLVGLPAHAIGAPLIPIMASVILGGVFGTTAIQPISPMPVSAWVVCSAFLLLVLYVGWVVYSSRRRGLALTVMTIWLWVGAVTSWVAVWSITAGGTLGAL